MNTVAIVMATESATEDSLVERARQAIGLEAWVVGECASIWTKQYSLGRTDEAFAAMVGLSREQICARRNVFERFSSHSARGQLSWSHFNVALAWDDADVCLEWACESEATVAEMRAWRRAKHGENLFEDFGENVPRPAFCDDEKTRVEADRTPNTSVASTEGPGTAEINSGVHEYVPCEAQPSGTSTSGRGEKKREKKTTNAQEQDEDPERIANAMDRALKRYSSEHQQKTVQRLLARLIARHDFVDLLLPSVSKPDECVDQIQSALNWSLEQFRRCPWTAAERPMARQLADAFNRAAIAATELASGEQTQKALFDKGPSVSGRVPLSEILREWNEQFETTTVPTDKRRAALRARLREPFFLANWREAIARARRSPYCCGENDRGWVANIDWFLRPDTVVKIMEGNHDTIEASSYSSAERREQDNFDAIRAALEDE